MAWLPGVLLAVLLLAGFALGLALALAIANVYFRDVSHLMALVFQFWFYLTPVVYSSDLVDRAVAARGGLFVLGHEVPVSLLYGLNPMERFVSVFRALLYDNRWPAWQDWAGASLSAVLALVVGVVLFQRYGGRVVEEL